MHTATVLIVAMLPLIVNSGSLTLASKSLEVQPTPVNGLMYWRSANNAQVTVPDPSTAQRQVPPIDFHHNHQHTRSGRCFWGTPVGPSEAWAEPTDFDVPDPFDLDPRLNVLQTGEPSLSAPIGYQIVHRSGDHLVLSPITYLSEDP